MDKVTVKLKSVSKALFNISMLGVEEVDISVVKNALKVEAGDKVFHVWSSAAEDTEAQVGKGEKLTEEEIKVLDTGKCPKCGKPLFVDHKQGLAQVVSCNEGHTYWVPPPPFNPEYIGTVAKLEEAAEAPEVPPPPEEETPPPPDDQTETVPRVETEKPKEKGKNDAKNTA